MKKILSLLSLFTFGYVAVTSAYDLYDNGFHGRFKKIDIYNNTNVPITVKAWPKKFHTIPANSMFTVVLDLFYYRKRGIQSVDKKKSSLPLSNVMLKQGIFNHFHSPIEISINENAKNDSEYFKVSKAMNPDLEKKEKEDKNKKIKIERRI